MRIKDTKEGRETVCLFSLDLSRRVSRGSTIVPLHNGCIFAGHSAATVYLCGGVMTRSVARAFGLAVAMLFVAASPSAHHSVSGQFDVTKKLILEGTVMRVDWVNPHIYVHLKVKDESGQEVVWRLGTVPVGMARAAGITKEELLAKDQVVKMSTYPARDGTKLLGWVYRIDYPSGKFILVAPDRA